MVTLAKGDPMRRKWFFVVGWFFLLSDLRGLWQFWRHRAFVRRQLRDMRP